MNCFLEKRLLGLGLGGVLVANGRGKSELPYTSQNAGSNIRTAWVVADVFREQFFAPVWSCEARFDRYLRNGESPNRIPVLSDACTGLFRVLARSRNQSSHPFDFHGRRDRSLGAGSGGLKGAAF